MTLRMITSHDAPHANARSASPGRGSNQGASVVTADQLYRLIEQGRHDIQAKRAFFRALPEATMYAHVAKDAAPEEPPRLIKVWHPGR